MKKVKLTTLCHILQDDQILLGYKKRGFGVGYWNGFGGKVEINEAIETAVLREVKEEAGILLDSISYSGTLHFTFEDDKDLHLEARLFRGGGVSGTLQESDEMQPQWFSITEIPYDTMWPADKFWLPHVLKGKQIHGHIHLQDVSTVLTCDLEVEGKKLKDPLLSD